MYLTPLIHPLFGWLMHQRVEFFAKNPDHVSHCLSLLIEPVSNSVDIRISKSKSHFQCHTEDGLKAEVR